MNMHIEWTQNQKQISDLKAENAQLLEVISAHNKKMSEGVYTTNEQCAKEVAEHDRLLAENAAQAKRIGELYDVANDHRNAYIAASKALDSQKSEIESLRKQVEMLLGSTRKTVLALAHASIHDPLYTAAYDELSESIKLASKNGE